jgi:dTDP-4-amino-4,6-dideoxygalactose transaminase
MEKIPALDLQGEYESLREEIDSAIAGVLRRGSFILGPEVSVFEDEFAAYCGTTQAVGVGSGTAALHLALLACGIEPGDEVVTSAHTAVATVAAIELTGARPVLVEIDPRRYTLDPERLEAALSPRTRAVIPVHLYGCPADLAPLLIIAHQRGLFVIEDCAQAHGARYHGQRVGAWGQMAAFSFYPTKNLGAYGDAGALVTNDPALAKRARMLRQYGWEQRYVSQLKGLNSRLDDMQAAILRVKLKYLDAWNARRRQLAGQYDRLLAGSGLVLPWQPIDAEHVYHQYVVRHARRDDLRAFLAEQGIQTLIHYPLPVHLQPAYRDLGYTENDFPETSRASREVLSLPIYPGLSDAKLETVCTAIKNWFSGKAG